jgi:hypothetical protein
MAQGRDTARHLLGLVQAAIGISLASNFHDLLVAGNLPQRVGVGNASQDCIYTQNPLAGSMSEIGMLQQLRYLARQPEAHKNENEHKQKNNHHHAQFAEGLWSSKTRHAQIIVELPSW